MIAPLPAGAATVLVLKPSSLGDVVHTLPAVVALKNARADLRIQWLVNPEWAPLLQKNPVVDEVIIFPRNTFRGRGLLQLPGWLRQISRLRPDVALDFQGLLRSALIARCSGARRIIGLSDAREGARHLYHEVAPASSGTHAVDRYLQLTSWLGVPLPGKPEFPLPAGERPLLMPENGDYVLLHPFARGAGKSLPAADVEKLISLLAPLRVVVAGRAAEQIPPAPNAVNLLNKTSLLELIWLIRNAAFTISVDSGPMHIAAAVTDRLLSIHGWSDPLLVGPREPRAWVWKAGRICRAGDYFATGGAGELPNDAQLEEIARFVRQQV